MGIDITNFWSHIGKLKTTTVVIGTLNVGITYYSYSPESEKEIFFLLVIIIAVSLSLIFLLANIFEIIKFTKSTKLRVKIFDIVFHGLMGILIFTGAVFMAIDVSDDRKVLVTLKYDTHQHNLYMERIFASFFGFLNSIFYNCIALEIYGRIRKREIPTT